MNENERAMMEEWSFIPAFAGIGLFVYGVVKTTQWVLVWATAQVVCR